MLKGTESKGKVEIETEKDDFGILSEKLASSPSTKSESSQQGSQSSNSYRWHELFKEKEEERSSPFSDKFNAFFEQLGFPEGMRAVLKKWQERVEKEFSEEELTKLFATGMAGPAFARANQIMMEVLHENPLELEQMAKTFAENPAKFEEMPNVYSRTPDIAEQVSKALGENSAEFEQMFSAFNEEPDFEQMFNALNENPVKFGSFGFSDEELSILNTLPEEEQIIAKTIPQKATQATSSKLTIEDYIALQGFVCSEASQKGWDVFTKTQNAIREALTDHEWVLYEKISKTELTQFKEKYRLFLEKEAQAKAKAEMGARAQAELTEQYKNRFKAKLDAKRKEKREAKGSVDPDSIFNDKSAQFTPHVEAKRRTDPERPRSPKGKEPASPPRPS